MSHFYISPGLTFMLPNEMERLGGIKNDSINPRGRLAYLLNLVGTKYLMEEVIFSTTWTMELAIKNYQVVK